MKIAIDFDKTICKASKFPDVGEAIPLAIVTIKELIKKGHRVYIWTVRDKGLGLEKAKDFCKENGLDISGYNIISEQHEYSVSPKMDYDLVIDDKALGCPLLLDKTNNDVYVNWARVAVILRQNGII